MDTKDILYKAVELGASDIFIVSGIPVTFKIDGHIKKLESGLMMPSQTKKFIGDIYGLANNRSTEKIENGDDDFSFSIQGLSRFRVCTYKQRGSYAAVIRVVYFNLPSPKQLNIPNTVINLCNLTKGMVLVTGPAGSGKSTTLACMIDSINERRSNHIITLEDPIEFLYKHKKSIVSQREISTDTPSYVSALKAALRQSPDVILLGEMRDHETMQVSMTAAETGHLLLSTLHTIGAANTLDRIIDSFPPNQQHQIRIQLSMVLQAVVSQQLVPTTDGRVIPAFEIMVVTPAIRNMIREAKVHQIDSVIASSSSLGMVTMDTSLYQLYKEECISAKNAILYSTSPDAMKRKIGPNL